MPDNEDCHNGGEYRVADIEATVQEHWGKNPHPELPDSVRMALSAVNTYNRRTRAWAAASDGNDPAVFVLCERPRLARKEHSAERAPAFRNGSSRLNGRIWFTNCDFTSGYFIESGCDDLGELFDRLEEQYHCGDSATIVVDPRAESVTLALYPDGVSNEELCYTYPVTSGAVDAEGIRRHLDGFHSSHVETPNCTGAKIWKDAGNAVPVEYVERTIQHDLLIYLSGVYASTCAVRPETTNKAGRADIVLFERTGSTYVFHAVLELKVLRSKWATREPVRHFTNLRAIVEAVRQAVAYQRDLQCRTAFACLYDMQKTDNGDEALSRARAIEGASRISILRWYLFHTSAQYRATMHPG